MKINFFRSALNLQRKPNTVTGWWLRRSDENYAQLAAVQRVKRLQKYQRGRFYWAKKLQTSLIFVAAMIFILTLIKAIERRQTHNIDQQLLSLPMPMPPIEISAP